MNGTWTVTVESKDGVAFNLSSPANRLLAWVESDDTSGSGNTTALDVDVVIEGGDVRVPAGAVLPRGATIHVVYQRARSNETQPWLNVSQVEGLGAEWEMVGTTLE